MLVNQRTNDPKQMFENKPASQFDQPRGDVPARFFYFLHNKIMLILLYRSDFPFWCQFFCSQIYLLTVYPFAYS